MSLNLKDYKYYLLSFSLVFIFSNEWLGIYFNLNLPSGFRHLYLILLSIILLGKCQPSYLSNTYYYSVVIVVFFGIIGDLISGTALLNSVYGCLFTILFSIVYINSTRVFLEPKDAHNILKAISLSMFFLGIFPVLDHIPKFPEAMRYDFGVFREVGAYATAMTIGVAACLAEYYLDRKRIFILLAVILSLFVFITVLKKSMLSCIFVWILFIIFFRDYKKIIFFLVLLAIIMMAIMPSLQENIVENVDYLNAVGFENHVRLGMYLTAARIAIDYFPVGSGFGSFGSLASIIDGYSPLYYEYGVDKIGANSEQAVLDGQHTLLDTFWPHIIAELGVFGTFFYLYLAFSPIKEAIGYCSQINTKNELKVLALFVIAVNGLILWEGLFLYTPEIPAFIFVGALISGIFVGIIKRMPT